jgi:putative membrane protein
MKRIGLMMIVVATAASIGCNRGDYPNREGSTTTGASDRGQGISTSDSNFVRDVAVANMAEIQLGRLAQERASNPQVKRFGQMMLAEHEKAGDALNAIAQSHNLTVPTQLDEKHQALRDKLSQLQGADFDRQYIETMIDSHQDVADTLESRIDRKNLADWKTRMSDQVHGRTETEPVAVTPEHSDNAVTMSINQWAANTYPSVQHHLAEAKALKDSVEKRNTTN